VTDGESINLVWAVGALALVGSALFARRIGFGDLIRMILSWVAIFAVFIVGFTYQNELLTVWNRVTGELLAKQSQQIAGRSLIIKQSGDGHFWVDTLINDRPVRFLIDSGATTTAMAFPMAKATGIEIFDGGFPTILSTANGDVAAKRGTIQKMSVGPLTVENLSVVVAEEFGDSNLLGMNFLSQLKSWRVEGQEMILEPKDSSF